MLLFIIALLLDSLLNTTLFRFQPPRNAASAADRDAPRYRRLARDMTLFPRAVCFDGSRRRAPCALLLFLFSAIAFFSIFTFFLYFAASPSFPPRYFYYLAAPLLLC